MTEPIRLTDPGATVDTLLTTVKNSNLSATHKITRSATIVVAASDSSNDSKDQADYVCDGTADDIQINAALLDIHTSGGGHLVLLYGSYSLSDYLLIYSNTWVDVDPSASITLSNTSNCYFARNNDMSDTSTDHDIKITGGKWYGNGTNQTRNYTSTPDVSYWGFGFIFRCVTTLTMENMYIQETNAWGIAHFNCSDLHFKTIRFYQISATGQNGDGITGTGSQYVYIEDVSGYTNDDMVAVCSIDTFSGSLAGHRITWTGRDSSHVYIRNVLAKKRGTKCTHRAVAVYATEGKTTSHVYITNVTGTSDSDGVVYIANAWPSDGTGYVDNIYIDTFDGESGLGSNANGIYFAGGSTLVVGRVFLNNINYIDHTSGGVNAVLLECNGGTVFVDGLRVIRADASVLSGGMRAGPTAIGNIIFFASNVSKTASMANVISKSVSFSGTLRGSGVCLSCDPTTLTGASINDVVTNTNVAKGALGPCWYSGTSWISLINGGTIA